MLGVRPERGGTGDFLASLGGGGHERSERRQAEAILELLNIAHLRDLRPKDLAYGHCKALGLAPQIVKSILRSPRELADSGLAVLLGEQLALPALDIAYDAYVLQRGKVALSGPASELRKSSVVIESYLS